MKPTRKVIDLHCDTISKAHRRELGLVNKELHLSLDKLPEHLRLCQAMAVFIPDEFRGRDAEEYFGAVLQHYNRQVRINKQKAVFVQDLEEIDDLLERYPLACILTVEGGAALAGKLENIKKLYGFGVRMMGLTWNGENELAGGCATDKGFSAFGRQAVREMETLGMVVDVSHLSDRGFEELRGFATRPFIASHSNARAVCNHRRNLTDAMFREIAKRGGIVGLNYYHSFIVEEGESATVDDLLRHVHHFLELGGEDVIALGSDYDGAYIPDYLNSVEKVEFLLEALEKSGISVETVDKIAYENAKRFFEDYVG